MVITMGIIGLFVSAAFVAFLFFPTSDYTLTESQKACVLTVEQLAEHYEIEITPGAGTWNTKRYLDGSVDIDYMYEDSSDMALWINCMLSIQRSVLDAKGVKEGCWLGSKISYKGVASLEEDNSVFRWGDASRFAYLVTEGERYGILFVTRKGSKVFYLEVANCSIEDPDEISALVTPLLERYEREVF